MKYIPIHPRTPSTRNTKGTVPRDIFIKLLKIIDERKILNVIRGQKIPCIQRNKDKIYSRFLFRNNMS